MDDRNGAVFHATWNLYPFLDELSQDVDKARALIDVTRAARETSGPGRDTAEEKLVEHLADVVRDCCALFDDAGFARRLDYPDCAGCPPELETPCTIMRESCAYALDCFAYARPRDQFAGTRRAVVFEILGEAGWVFNISSAIPLSLAALKRNRRLESRGAIVFMEAYFKARNGDPVPDEVVNALLSLVEHTDNRSNATGALNVLVESGNIGEFEALSRLDDWKEEHPWA